MHVQNILVPKCMSCHKAIIVTTGRAHFFHDYIYLMPIFRLASYIISFMPPDHTNFCIFFLINKSGHCLSFKEF